MAGCKHRFSEHPLDQGRAINNFNECQVQVESENDMVKRYATQGKLFLPILFCSFVCSLLCAPAVPNLVISTQWSKMWTGNPTLLLSGRKSPMHLCREQRTLPITLPITLPQTSVDPAARELRLHDTHPLTPVPLVAELRRRAQLLGRRLLGAPLRSAGSLWRTCLWTLGRASSRDTSGLLSTFPPRS